MPFDLLELFAAELAGRELPGPPVLPGNTIPVSP